MKNIISHVLKKILWLFNNLIPKKEYILFKSIPDYSGNARALSDYIYHNHKEYLQIWIVNKKYKTESDSINVRFVKEKTFVHYYYYLISKYVVTTHNEMISTSSKNQIYISLWHGMPLKKIGYLGESDHYGMKDYSSYRISTSELTRALISASFREKANKVYITGQPRNDYLFEEKSLFKNIQDSNEYKKIIFYMPTFRENCTDPRNVDGRYSDGNAIRSNNFLRVDDFNLDKFNKYLEENEILFLMKLHPFEEKSISKDHFGPNIKVINSKILDEDNIDVNHILSSIDILITDYSSVYFDFLILNKPIIFLVPDLDSYSRSRGGFTLEPFDLWTPGPKVVCQNELLHEVSSLLNGDDLYLSHRIEINSTINKFSDNNNSKRVFEQFFMKLE